MKKILFNIFLIFFIKSKTDQSNTNINIEGVT